MSRFYGAVGYAKTVNTAPGVFEEVEEEMMYYGDILRNARRLESGENLNDQLIVNNSISILADAHALNHFFEIRYVVWEGAKWKVTNVEVQRPRLILTLGKVYNG